MFTSSSVAVRRRLAFAATRQAVSHVVRRGRCASNLSSSAPTAMVGHSAVQHGRAGVAKLLLSLSRRGAGVRGLALVGPGLLVAAALSRRWQLACVEDGEASANAGRGVVLCETTDVAAAQSLVTLSPRRKYRWWRVLWRSLLLFCRAMPVVVALPFCWLFWARGGEYLWWRLTLGALQAHGPLAVKFSQWASTRPDILPPSVCAHFAELQDAVRPHRFRHTSKALEEAFGPDWQKQLQVVDQEPVGSGCMAQVYLAQLSEAPGRAGREVALKVRHPGAQDLVDLDLEVLWKLVHFVEAIWRGAQYLGMSEALSHLEAFVRPQADLRIEADNMERFRKNFAFNETGKGLRVCFPEVVRPFVDEAVLVESYEKAVPLQAVLGQTGKHGKFDDDAASRVPGVPDGMVADEVRERVAKVCMDMFMKMLFADNFIHGDLHPGNIHFRFEKDPRSGLQEVELVIFDAGLAINLSRQDRSNFVEVFHAIATRNGSRAGHLMLDRTPGDKSRVIDPERFVEGVGSLIDSFVSGGLALGQVSLGDAFSRLISLACDHRVKLETSFVTVANSIILIEGVGRQLNPVVDLLLQARPLLVDAMMGNL